MAKTDFTKVEEILAAGLQKMNVEHLCDLADIAAGMGHQTPPGENPLSHRQKILILSLKINFSRLQKIEKKIYSKLNIKKEKLISQLDKPGILTEDEWEKLEKLKERTDKLIQEHFPEIEDDQLIEKERSRHINKRFNINEKWLPLQ